MTNPKRVLNVVGFIIVVVLNALGSSGILFGESVGDVSDKYATVITPAGFAFSIWGVIYFFQACFVVWNILPSQENNTLLIEGVSWYYFLTCLFNSGWIIIFSTGSVIGVQVSSYFILQLLVFILIIYVKCKCWLRANTSWAEFIFLDVHFSLYASWVTVASIVNVSISFVAAGNVDSLGGISATTWGIVMLVVALVINLLVVATRADFIYPLVLAWATNAIRVESEDTSPDVSFTAMIVSIIALVVSLLTLVYRVVVFFKNKQQEPKQDSGQQDSGQPLFKNAEDLVYS